MHGNATEHIEEMARGMRSNGHSQQAINLRIQGHLQELQEAVRIAGQQHQDLGSAERIEINANGWNLVIDAPRETGQLPAVVHALPDAYR